MDLERKMPRARKISLFERSKQLLCGRFASQRSFGPKRPLFLSFVLVGPIKTTVSIGISTIYIGMLCTGGSNVYRIHDNSMMVCQNTPRT